jgi:chaperonin GroEL
MQKITFHEETREKLRKGVNQLAEVVGSTLGPSGHSVILDLEGGMPVSTKDGVTVAKAIHLDDPEENVGAQMLKQASIKTADEAGDGTTTATILANAIYNKGLSLQKNFNSVAIKKGMEAAVGDITTYIQEHISKPITDKGQLAQIAAISANGDKEIGTLVSTALNDVGTEGAITIEESKTGETYLDTVEGIQFNQGYKSPYFVTDNETMTAVLEDVVILFADQRLNTIKDLIPMLNGVAAANKALLIVAEDIGGEVISTLVVNKIRAGLKVVAVKAPEFGDRRKAALEDMAILTGGTVVSPEKGMRIDKFNTEWFGTAKKVTISRDTTTIIGADGDQDAILKRVDEIKNQIDTAKSTYDKEQLQARLARFAGGVAVMYVGGHTEADMREKKDRVDDALHATRAALEEGICPGGGAALLHAAKAVSEGREFGSDDFETGRKIVLEACTIPFTQILKNAGAADVKSMVEIAFKRPDWDSFNPIQGQWTNMEMAGIIDPTKVVRLALRNAVSVASTMLTSEAMVVNVPDKKDDDSQLL